MKQLYGGAWLGEEVILFPTFLIALEVIRCCRGDKESVTSSPLFLPGDNVLSRFIDGVSVGLSDSFHNNRSGCVLLSVFLQLLLRDRGKMWGVDRKQLHEQLVFQAKDESKGVHPLKTTYNLFCCGLYCDLSWTSIVKIIA